jgi:predicted tellurium resistance membrane protein TerC
LLLKLMQRFPIVITLGAGLLGWVAVEMAVADPAIVASLDLYAPWLHAAGPAAGALLVIAAGRLLAAVGRRGGATGAAPSRRE